MHKKFQTHFYLVAHLLAHERESIKHSAQAIVDTEHNKHTPMKIIGIQSNRQIHATGSKALQICRPLYGWDRNVECIDEHTKRM